MAFDQQAYSISLICTLCSIIGVSFILFTFLLIKETRSNFFFNMGLYLAVSDLFLAISSLNFIDPIELNQQMCNTFGLFREFALLSSFIWTSLISWSVYKSIRDNLADDDLFAARRYYIFIGYVPPLLMALILMLFDDYGPSWIFCWLNPKKDGYLWKTILLLYLPFFVSFTLNMIWFVKSYRYLKKYIVEKVSFEFWRLLMYPLISFTCNIGGFVYVLERIYDYPKSQDEIQFIYYLRYYHLITRQLQGLLTAIAYGLNYQVRLVLKQKIKAYFGYGIDIEEDLETTGASLSMQRRNDNLNQFILDREELISKYFNMQNIKSRSLNFLE